MIRFFDYIFIRVYILYSKWKEDYPYPFAEGALVVFQFFIILNFFTVLTFFNIVPKKMENGKHFALILILILYLINHNRYSKNYKSILEDYNLKSDTYRRKKGFLLLLLVVMIVFFPILIGVLRNNYSLEI